MMKFFSPGILFALGFTSIFAGFQIPNSYADSAPWVGVTLWGTNCSGKSAGYGPFDYLLRGQYPKELTLVESVHFTPEVENLVSGSSGSLANDLDYTIRAWPNHHRALNSVVRLRIRKGSNFPKTGTTPAECYLQRAIRFSPKDPTTQMLYGMLLHRLGNKDKALELYQSANELDPNNVQTMYNMGLLLCDLQRYKEAKEYADIVYARGFPLPGLSRRLERAGYTSTK